MTLLRRSSFRHLTRHRWQAALAILGVGLGVAVVLAVDLATSSARRGFTVSAETLAGRATHAVEGGPGGLPDSSFARLRSAPGVDAAAPLVEGQAVAPGNRVLRILGVDPFSEGAFRRYGTEDGGGPAAALLIGVRAGFLSRGTAAELGVGPGDWLPLTVAGRRDSVRVAGLLDPAETRTRLGLENVLIVDIGTGEALLGRAGPDRIDVIARSDDALRRAVAGLPGATVRPAGARASGLAEMTRAFDLNLRALSLLALIFGIFLIYNSVTFSVVQRRRLLGTLRALGATRRQVFALVQAEALTFALAGTALGVALGLLLGAGLVRLVTRTIQDLYFAVTVRELIITPGALARAVAIGVGGTLLAALPPAWEAATSHPRDALLRSTLESGLRRRLPALTIGGLALAALGGATLMISDGVDGSFIGLFGVILGAALLTPGTTVLLMRVLRPLAGAAFGVLGRMAAGGVAAGLSRTAPAVAALTVAVGVTIGVAVMIGSFRGSVVTWLDRTLAADIYVAPTRPSGSATGRIEAAAVERLAEDPAVAEVRRYRRGEVPGVESPVVVMAIGVDSRLRGQLDLIAGDAAGFWPAFVAGRAVIVSEPFRYRQGTDVGDTLRLRTERGVMALPVVGVFRDYGSDRGMVMMSYAGYRRLYADPTITAVALNLAPGADPAPVIERLRSATAGIQPLTIRSDRALRDASLTVFDRTFAITQVLRLLALVVAFVAVLSALMALQLERERELGVLRANGLTPGQVWGLVASQTGLMGLAAGLMAVPLGGLLAVLLVEFVNRRSFGWSIELAVAPALLVQAVVIALAASLLAGIYPSWKMARTSPAEALRSE